MAQPCPLVVDAQQPAPVDASLFAIDVEVGPPTTRGPTTRYQGHTSQTPNQVYERYRTDGGLTLLGGETEGHEAEVLASDGQRRIALKVVACSVGSTVDATVAPEQTSSTETSGQGQ